MTKFIPENDYQYMAALWNSYPVSTDREIQPRNYMYASELGSADIDVYLKMKGTKYTNVPNARARRKFDAGNIWEGILQNIYRRFGLLVELSPDDKRIKTEFPGMIPVSGRFDILLNGVKNTADFKQIKATAETALSKLYYDDPLVEYELKKTIMMADQYIASGKTLSYFNQIGEAKSMSLMAFNGMDASDKPYESHALQSSYYTRYNKKYNNKHGSLLCVCKDDTRIKEFRISGAKNDPYQKKIMESIKSKSHYYLKDERPPLEPMLVIQNGRFSMNFNVAYSNYLTMLYGFEHQEDYREKYSGKIASWNRVLKRMAEDQNLTKANEVIIKEMKDEGYDPDRMELVLKNIIKSKKKREDSNES